MANRNWIDIPFHPRRVPFFYGWVIVGACIIGTLSSIPGQTVGVGVFTEPLIAALHIDRMQLSLAYMFGTVASSFLLPFAGQLLDKIGARAMGAMSAAGLSLSLVFLSQTDRIALVGTVNSALLGMTVSTVAFLAIRFFGQGCLTMVSRVMIGKWFHHRRGLASAIAGLFIAITFFNAPWALKAIMTIAGWRGTALLMALIIGVGTTAVALLLYRDNPQQCGLVPDGVQDPAWHKKMAARVPEIHRHFTRAQALRTPAFWAFTLGLCAQSLSITAVTFHIESLGAEMGLDAATSFQVFAFMPLFSVSSNFIAGYISDKIRLRWLLYTMMFAQGVGGIGLLSFYDPLGWWMLIAGYGVAGGLFGTLINVTWPRLFGLQHLGAITGLNLSFMVFASAIGPAFFSAMQLLTGDYLFVKILSLLMPVGVLIVALFAENPQRQFAEQGPDGA